MLWSLCCLLIITTTATLKFRQFNWLFFLLAGFLYALLACQIQLLSQLDSPQNLTFQGSVDSLPKKNNQKVSFISTNPTSGQHYLLNWYLNNKQQLPTFKPGQLFEFEVKLKPPSGMVNGVGFDREKWLFRHGIDAIGTIKTAKPLTTSSLGIKHSINDWRAQLSKQIEDDFPDNNVNALIQALSIGDKSHFEQIDFKRFQATGTAHLIAISGLHIGMVAMIGWLLGSFCFWLWPQQKVTTAVWQVSFGLCFALTYAVLAGFAVSTQRALIMLTVYALFKLSNRSSYSWDVWSISLLLVLLLDPLNVLDAGFWLSFAAVAILILCFQGINQSQGKIFQFVHMQWRLLLGMLPLSLLVFSHVNLLTPLINMMMIPLMTFIIVPLIMLLILAYSLLTWIPEILVNTLNYGTKVFLELLNWLATNAVLSINISIEHSWQMLLLTCGVIWLILPKAIPQRFWGLVLILLATINPRNPVTNGQFKARFFDVGQGLAVHIETANHHMLYDVGAAYDSGFNMADAVLLPYFGQQKIKNLDALLLSHQDNDHSGASTTLINQIKVKQIYGTEPQHQPCIAGVQWQWDGVQLTVLSPYNLQPYLKNNSSCVLRVESADGFSMLLTGDIESPVEYRLSQSTTYPIKADVLLIPHHGSKTSSTESFISAVNPTMAINSSGQFNPFNHPAKKVMATYHKLGIPVIDTQYSGLIEISSDQPSKPVQYRQQHPKIWRKKSPE